MTMLMFGPRVPRWMQQHLMLPLWSDWRGHPPDEPRAWWYEIFETCRRTFLASLVCVTSSLSAQLLAAIGITLVRCLFPIKQTTMTTPQPLLCHATVVSSCSSSFNSTGFLTTTLLSIGVLLRYQSPHHNPCFCENVH